ncbi:hypothetical protein HanIR_Chr05g0249211 [Helianthus annuus]|nr:hypothetical protein HanIR_Chr05g0249211 [Helianthus annuus]
MIYCLFVFCFYIMLNYERRFLSYIIYNVNIVPKIPNIFFFNSPNTLATTDILVKKENREETHHPKDVMIKQEEIQEIPDDVDLDDDKWWCNNIDDILEMFKPYDY